MATNTDGHLVDDKGNVVVDFVWGNLPIQPNDGRTTHPILNTSLTGTNLNFALDNHVIVETDYSGYPLYTPNTHGAFDGVPPVAYMVVPNTVGQTLANAITSLVDAGYLAGNITTAAAATNAAIAYTVVTRTAGSFDATITAAGAVAQYPVGTAITTTGTVAGTWIVKSVSSTNLVTFTTTASTVLAAGTGTVAGVIGTIQLQSVAAGAADVALGTAITITPYAVAS